MKTKPSDQKRPVTITRDLPVRDLSSDECAALLVHCHSGNSGMRHKAYILKKHKGEAFLYFNVADQLAIQEWIIAEKESEVAGY